jgi:hypothetical protein
VVFAQMRVTRRAFAKTMTLSNTETLVFAVLMLGDIWRTERPDRGHDYF